MWRPTHLPPAAEPGDLVVMTRPTFARWLQAAFTGGVIACAVPAVAGATDYCVAPNVSCDQAHTVPSVEAALSLADDATDADRVLLGAATYTPPPGYSFEYHRSDAPVEIVGAGVGQTVLTRPAGAKGRLLTLYGGPGSLIRDLTIRLPENVVTGFTGLRTTSAVRHIQVVDEAAQSGQRYGVELGGGGTLEDSSVVLDPAADSWGVSFFDGGATVRRSSLSANLGVYSYYGGTLERTRVTGSYAGMYAYHGTTNVVNSLIRYGTGGGPGIAARTQGASGDTFVNIDGATIIGPGLPFSVGVSAGTFSSPALSSEVSLTNSVIRGAAHALDARTAVGATGHATLTATYSNYDPSGNTTAENGSISEANVTNIGDAGFVDAGGGDYHLLAGSPLVDAGDPATAQGLDLDGNPLVADGDADGTARRDMGAYELPVPSGGQPADGQPSRRRGGRGPGTRERRAVVRAGARHAGAPGHRLPRDPHAARPARPVHAQRGRRGDAEDPARGGRKPHALPHHRHADEERDDRRQRDPAHRQAAQARGSARPLPHAAHGHGRGRQPLSTAYGPVPSADGLTEAP